MAEWGEVSSSVRDGGPIASTIYAALRDRLTLGQYAPGESISVEALRVEFSVSKQPVMETLRRLSSDGLVSIIPQVGCVSVAYSDREIEDFFRLFSVIEGSITHLAALRASASQIRELAIISDRLENLQSSGESLARVSEYQTLNREFHTKIHEMANSEIMHRTSRRMWDLSDYLVNTSGPVSATAASIATRHDEHEMIRHAIEARDPEAAERNAAEHVRATIAIVKGLSSGDEVPH